MFKFTKEISYGFLEFCKIQDFVNLACLSNEYLTDIQYYFKTKKILNKFLNIKQTIYNSLLKVKFTTQAGVDHVGGKIMYEIVKVVKIKPVTYEKNKNIKIYYWCISSPATIGSDKNGYNTVIYPNHRNISDMDINDDNLIPFR